MDILRSTLAAATAWAGVALAPPIPAAPSLAQAPCTTERISLASGGAQGNWDSFAVFGNGTLSADGRWVVFWSAASNLVPGDLNSETDTFVRDRWSQTTLLASLNSQGEQANGFSGGGNISANGRFVAFTSRATNLVPTTIGWDNVFVRDMMLGATERVSQSTLGGEGNDISGGGALSVNGRYVAFWSKASNLVPNDTNGQPDIFWHDRQTHATTRVSISSSGEEANGPSGLFSISNDGQFVAFESTATNLVAGDTNGFVDVFIHDVLIGETSRVSVSSGGGQASSGGGRPALSGDGRSVAFESSSPDLVPGDTNNRPDIFVHDRQTLETVRVSLGPGGVQANDSSYWPSISADARYVAFQSVATNLVAGGSSGIQLFARDRTIGVTTLISATSSGNQGNGPSYNASLSPDGKAVAFESWATNLVPGDTNGHKDVFVRDCGGPLSPRVYCAAKTNSLGCTPAIGFAGSPSASTGSGFDISAGQVLSKKPGLLLYGLSGPSMLPFQAGWLCVQPPLVRTPVQLSGGAASLDCSGDYHFDFNAWIALGADPALGPGIAVWSQYWSRDPLYASPSSTGLTDALVFEIGP